MSTFCPSPLHACFMRATLLDAVGNVDPGADNSYTSDKLIQFQLTPVSKTGDDLELKGGCGNVLASWKTADHQSRFDIEIDRGALEPALEALMLGATAITSGPNVIGVDYPSVTVDPPLVAVEFWTENIEDDHLDPVNPYTHWVFPAGTWVLGQITYGNDFGQPKITGSSKSNSVWGHGPYGDQAAVIEVGGYIFQATVPTAACGYSTVTPSS